MAVQIDFALHSLRSSLSWPSVQCTVIFCSSIPAKKCIKFQKSNLNAGAKQPALTLFLENDKSYELFEVNVMHFFFLLERVSSFELFFVC